MLENYLFEWHEVMEGGCGDAGVRSPGCVRWRLLPAVPPLLAGSSPLVAATAGPLYSCLHLWAIGVIAKVFFLTICSTCGGGGCIRGWPHSSLIEIL
jgi:hypothetical protein